MISVGSVVQVHPDPPIKPGLGAIAQLGERLLCKQEVTGSIPVGSTRAGLVDDREKIEMLERKDPWEKSKRLADLIGRGCA